MCKPRYIQDNTWPVKRETENQFKYGKRSKAYYWSEHCIDKNKSTKDIQGFLGLRGNSGAAETFLDSIRRNGFEKAGVRGGIRSYHEWLLFRPGSWKLKACQICTLCCSAFTNIALISTERERKTGQSYNPEEADGNTPLCFSSASPNKSTGKCECSVKVAAGERCRNPTISQPPENHSGPICILRRLLPGPENNSIAENTE